MTWTTFTIIAALLCAFSVWFIFACTTAPLAEQDDTGFHLLGGDHGE